jgi:small-conductance mechanosensitive channel
VQPNPQLLSESTFFALRFVLAVIILAAIFLAIRRAIHLFVRTHAKELGRKRYIIAGTNVAILAIGFLLNTKLSFLLQRLGEIIGHTIPAITKEWTGMVLVALLNTLVLLAFLLLLIQLVGALYWFIDARLAARAAMKKHIIGSPAMSLYIIKTLSFINRFVRTIVLVLLIAAFVFEVFTFYKGMRPVVEMFTQSLGTPGHTILQAIVDYLPNLAYLGIIALIGWGLMRLIKFTFDSINDGTLRIPGFMPEWAESTYSLLRFVVLLFLLMISFPYLPGAGSKFFEGFSIFIGALVTFGSSGAIGNIMSGVTLTYTNAFRVGDVINTNGTTGTVQEKTLLVTRILTFQNELVTIPNGSLLSTPTMNYTRMAASKGLVLTVDAGIGYDVDWRMVQRLMLEGAARTPHILSDPPPRVWQNNLGDYAVVYQLRAYSDRADLMMDTHSELRANVLDVFNREGVEIMTPSIFAHRDASSAAIPEERLEASVAPRVIAVDVRQSKPDTPDPQPRS